MALPGPSTHWRLSEIAEELENLDMSLDLDLAKDMDEFLRGSSMESDSQSLYSNTSSLLSDKNSEPVELRNEDNNIQRKRTKSRSRISMPNVPPPPPPTQQTPSQSGSSTPPKPRTSSPKFPRPRAPSTPPPALPSTPPPVRSKPTTPSTTPSTPTPQLPSTPCTPMSPPPLPPPDTPPPATPPVIIPPPMTPTMTSQSSRILNGVSVLPPLPKFAIAQQNDTEQDDGDDSVWKDDSMEDDLPPPPPIFDLPEPNYAPPSPCTSPLVLSGEQPALFRLNRIISPSPLTLSDTTSGYSTSCASSEVNSYSTSCASSEINSSCAGSGTERHSTVYAPTSVASTSSDQPSDMSDDMEPVFEKISEDDIHQVEMFYRSHKSQVYVCPGLANLYFGPARQDGSGEKWELLKTGIPVLLMDTGDARRQRKIQIILAEKGSGFILWKDNIDQLSNFKSLHSRFQTMYLSKDHTKLAGLSYDDDNAASDFLQNLQDFTSDPDDEALKMGKNRKKKAKKQKYKAPKKTDISQPCGFVHVTKLDRNDHEQFVNQGNTPILQARNQNHMDSMSH